MTRFEYVLHETMPIDDAAHLIEALTEKRDGKGISHGDALRIAGEFFPCVDDTTHTVEVNARHLIAACADARECLLNPNFKTTTFRAEKIEIAGFVRQMLDCTVRSARNGVEVAFRRPFLKKNGELVIPSQDKQNFKLVSLRYEAFSYKDLVRAARIALALENDEELCVFDRQLYRKSDENVPLGYKMVGGTLYKYIETSEFLNE